jgi:nitroimidazol reductase NimA-like FMN-containing flavoprotein (pyridoxamine 5'-phosphate oxidase superfamily)
MATRLTKKESKFIGDQNVGRVATVDKKGMPHNVPVCPVLDRGKVYFATEIDAKKVKNIRANPRIAMVFDVYSDSWKKLRGVMLQCKAGIVDEGDFEKIRKKLYRKYPQYEKEAPIDPEDSVIVELQPVKKFSWGL